MYFENETEKVLSSITTAWRGHKDFSMWLVNRIKPTTIVELGVDYGFSTLCFCLPNIGTVYGIDCFEGDVQTGIRNTENSVIENCKKLQIQNLVLIKDKFDDVQRRWTKPIDILHIDGLHTYDAVSNDYAKWQKFVREDGIVLFHDTCVEDPSFGVKKLFDSIQLPKANFKHSSGLGIVSKNSQLINEIKKLFDI